MEFTNCKIELKLKWTKHSVLASTRTNNANTNPNNIIFTLKGTKLYVPILTFSRKDNGKLSKVLNKVFEIFVY